jgi:hypothetical protein
MSQFDWTSEEERVDIQTRPETAGPTADRRRLWLLLGAVVALFLVGWSVYGQATRRADAGITAVEEAVLSSHRLVEQAIRQGDSELLRNLLSGRDSGWYAAQQRLADPATTIWNMTPLDEAAELVAINLTNDLLQAELTFDRRWRLPDGELATLRQTIIYRRAADRWLLAPPLEDFWGEWLTEERDHFQISYPARDQELTLALIARLEPELTRICQTPGLTCPAHWRFRLYFSDDPGLLFAERPNFYNEALLLPAPSLLGEPLDEIGWQALTAGYLTRIRSAALLQRTNSLCCREGLLQQMLYDYQLAQWGEGEWRLTRQDYAALMAREFPLDLFVRYWDYLPQEELAYSQEGMALVEYLLASAPHLPPATWLARLQEHTHLYGLLNSAELTPETLAAAWPRFLDERAYQSEPPPAPLPSTAVQLLCHDGGRDLLLRWSLDQPRPVVDMRDRHFTQLRPLPDASGALLVEIVPNGTQSAAYNLILHQPPEQERLLITDIPDDFALNLYEQPDPTRSQLTLYTFNTNFNQPVFEQLDLSLCAELADCGLSDISGLPVWSPDGRQAVIMQLRRGVLALSRQPADLSERPTLLGNGWSPFWLNNEEYGFLRPQTVNDAGALRAETHLVTAVVGEDRPTLLADYEAMAAAIPAAEQPPALVVTYAMTSPTRDGRVFIVASYPPRGDLYLLVYDPATTAVALLESLPGLTVSYPPIRFAPDGRWLSLNAHLRDETRSFFWLYNLENGAAQSYYFPLNADQSLGDWLPRWTADGRWVILPQSDHLALFAPDYGYQQRLAYENGLRCASAVWVEEKKSADFADSTD